MTAVDLQRRGDRDPGELAAAIGPFLDDDLVDVAFPDGAGTANITLLGRLARAGRDVVVKLVDAAGNAYLDPDLGQQAAVLRWVREHTTVPVPEVLAVEASGEVAGAQFLVLERITGRVPSDFPNYHTEGWVADASPEQRRTLWASGLDQLVALAGADASSLAGVLPDRAGLVAYWRRMHDWVSERADVAAITPYLEWVEQRPPSAAPQGLSWGDARLGNQMFCDSACVAVLDWEMASLAGPLMDLAWWLMFDVNHTVDAGLPRLPGLGSREETIEYWRAGTGQPVDDLPWFEALALVQLALLRANAFAQRAAAGLPVPGRGDPRAVDHLLGRLDTLVAP